jgi:hypothetical protein
MTKEREQELFEKLKDALNYEYLIDNYSIFNDDSKEVNNIDDYIKLIKIGRELDKEMYDDFNRRLYTYTEFVHYLANKSIGDIDTIIEEFDNCTYVNFEGYKEVHKEKIDGEIYLHFMVNETKLKAHWQASDNYAVWQTCGICGDDYSGYMLFPTHNKKEYFCVYYQC